MSQVTLLLPAGEGFGGQRLHAPLASALGRADIVIAAAGRQAQLRRVVDWPEGEPAIAALSRQIDVGDAGDVDWLRADPVHLQADINGVRMLAHGPALRLCQAEADVLADALASLFAEAGMRLDAPRPERWYLRLPARSAPPVFAAPGDVLGDDVFEHTDHAPQARRWRALAAQAQVTLYNHRLNQERASRGLASINALWFWGAGRLPERPLRSGYRQILSDDEVLRALAGAVAKVAALPSGYRGSADGLQGDRLFDLAAMHDLHRLQQDWLQPALHDLHAGHIDLLELDTQDGRRLRLHPRQRLRFWRRPLASLAIDERSRR